MNVCLLNTNVFNNYVFLFGCANTVFSVIKY